MVGSRTLTALVGLAVSLAISVAAWIYLDTLALFLFVPFVPILFRSGSRRSSAPAPPQKRCPRCGFRTRHPDYDHCPRDGTRLERERSR